MPGNCMCKKNLVLFKHLKDISLHVSEDKHIHQVKKKKSQCLISKTTSKELDQ